MSAAPRTAILRAEIVDALSSEVACALEMSDSAVFIATEALRSVGDVVQLRLSFPRAVVPVLVTAKVVQVRLSSGPGSPPGFVAEFLLDDEEERQSISELAQRLRRPSGVGPVHPELLLLLVEDNRLIRDMFAYALERYFRQRAGKVRLVQAPSVGDALTALERERPFDLALVDHLLPDETGASLIARLRAHPTFHRMSIVGMSVGGAEARRAMLGAGADIFLDKPIVLKDLFCTLEFLMSACPRSDRGVA